MLGHVRPGSEEHVAERGVVEHVGHRVRVVVAASGEFAPSSEDHPDLGVRRGKAWFGQHGTCAVAWCRSTDAVCGLNV